MTKEKARAMTLGEATETITSIKYVCRTLLPPKEQEALRLGIEALKRIDNIRNVGNVMPGSLLPGETED